MWTTLIPSIPVTPDAALDHPRSPSPPRSDFISEEDRKIYQRYRYRLNRSTTLFECPHRCGKAFLSKDYERHCWMQHQLYPKRVCVWCNGVVSWFAHSKVRHASHVFLCWKTFLQVRSSSTLRSNPSLASLSLWNLPLRACEVIWPVPLQMPKLTYRTPSLNTAVSAVRLFLNDSIRRRIFPAALPDAPVYQWFHVVVREPIYPQFVKRMHAALGHYRMLPHSCWCAMQDHTRHRHLIVLVLPDAPPFFQTIAKPLGNEIVALRIFRYKDLVDTLGEVSDQRRRPQHCPLAREGDERDAMKTKATFALHPLPNDYRLFLSMQWDGGVLEEKEIREMRDDEERIVYLRQKAQRVVSDTFQLHSQPTLYALHLFRAQMIYFQKKPSYREPFTITKQMEIQKPD